jgi:hypothetical protein
MSLSHSVLFVCIGDRRFHNRSHIFDMGLEAAREVFSSIVASESFDSFSELRENHLFECLVCSFSIRFLLKRVSPGESRELIHDNYEKLFWSS